WFQPCSFNVTFGGFSVILEGLPGSMVGTHYHVGTVHGYTMRGHWRYLEHDWIAKPGTYIYEPAGEAHTLVITEDSPEPMVTLFVVGGGLIYLDKAVNGGFAAYEDGFTLLELTRKHYRETGLDVRQLDLLVRYVSFDASRFRQRAQSCFNRHLDRRACLHRAASARSQSRTPRSSGSDRD